MAYKYVFQNYNPETMARAVGLYLPVSLKKSIEVATFIRGKKVDRALRELDGVVEKKVPVPFRKFFKSIPHRRGPLATGRFPVNTASEIRKVLISAISNAKEKGLEESQLVVRHISAQKGPTLWHYGRQSRRKRKVAYVEIVVEATSEKKSVKSESSALKKQKKEVKK